jgi:hypothetical protein
LKPVDIRMIRVFFTSIQDHKFYHDLLSTWFIHLSLPDHRILSAMRRYPHPPWFVPLMSTTSPPALLYYHNHHYTSRITILFVRAYLRAYIYNPLRVVLGELLLYDVHKLTKSPSPGGVYDDSCALSKDLRRDLLTWWQILQKATLALHCTWPSMFPTEWIDWKKHGDQGRDTPDWRCTW